MEEGQDSPQQSFHFRAETRAAPQQLLSRAPQQEQARGQGVEEAALGKEEREEDVLPGQVRIVGAPELAGTEAVEGESTGEDEGGHAEGARPASQGQVESGGGQKARHPKQRPKRDADLHEHGGQKVRRRWDSRDDGR